MSHNPANLALWVLLAWSHPIVAAEPEDGSVALASMRFSTLTPVSDSFSQQTSDAIQTIPEHVWQAIETGGWRVRLAEFVVDAQPELVNDRPRGWPADATWQNTDAIHLPTERLLVLAEKRRNSRGQVVPTARVAGVLRHEMGHAFDMATGNVSGFRSASDEFRAAYMTDVGRMSPETAQELAYYLQDSDAGRQEAYAEAFGITLGGGSDEKNTAKFREFFPEVLAFLRRDLESEQMTEEMPAPQQRSRFGRRRN